MGKGEDMPGGGKTMPGGGGGILREAEGERVERACCRGVEENERTLVAKRREEEGRACHWEGERSPEEGRGIQAAAGCWRIQEEERRIQPVVPHNLHQASSAHQVAACPTSTPCALPVEREPPRWSEGRWRTLRAWVRSAEA